MSPVREQSDHPVLARGELLQYELGLALAQMEYSRHAGGNRVVLRGEVAIHEQMVVGCAFPLLGSRGDLNAGCRENDTHFRATYYRSVGGLNDLDGDLPRR